MNVKFEVLGRTNHPMHKVRIDDKLEYFRLDLAGKPHWYTMEPPDLYLKIVSWDMHDLLEPLFKATGVP